MQTRAPAESDTQRLEAFSDGVFTIAITLLIVEIKVPQVQATEGANTLSLASGVMFYTCGLRIKQNAQTHDD